MTQKQEGEQQEEAKRPESKRWWKGFYWFTCLGTSLLAFFMIDVWATWNDRGDGWQAFLFVLVGVAFYAALCFWRGKARGVGLVGTLLWSVIAWSGGHAYETANTLFTPRIGQFAYQSELIFAASVPFVLLFLAFILLSNRSDFIGK